MCIVIGQSGWRESSTRQRYVVLLSFVREEFMIIAIVFAHIWGVLQLILLSTLTRTIRVRTVLAALATGLYACSIGALILQVAWTRAAAAWTSNQLYEIVRLDSYTLGPFIEEIIKVVPLVILIWAIPNVRRQWSHVDCVLVGAATGSGFGLAEDLFRFSSAVNRSIPVSGGWMIPTGLSAVAIPSPLGSLRSWLPSAAVADSLLGSGVGYNAHLAWSAIAGLAVALIFLQRHRTLRRCGLMLLLYAALDHAASNYALVGSSGVLSLLAVPFKTLRGFLWLMPIVALGVGSWLDWPRQRAGRVIELTLASERQSAPRFIGLLRAAMAKPPGTVFLVTSLCRLRRAYATAVSVGMGSVDELRESLLKLCGRIDGLTSGSERMVISQMNEMSLRSLKLGRPQVIIWLGLVLPSAIWLVLGGFPQSAWMQRLLAASPVWVIIRVLSFPALIRLAWQVVGGLRGWRQMTKACVGDVAAEPTLRLLAGVGAFLFGAYALILALSGQGPNGHMLTNFHVLEAVGSAIVIGSLLLALSALALFPPLAMAFGEIAAEAEIGVASMIESEALGTGEVLTAVGESAGLDGAGLSSSAVGERAAESAAEISFEDAFRDGVPFQDYGAFDSLGRPTGIRAVVTQETLLGGGAPNPLIEPPGWSGGSFGEARAHLLGAQLGGTGQLPENLVTFYQQANLQMLKFENQIRLAAESGETIAYSATPIYGGGGNIPIAIELQAEGSQGLRLFVSIKNVLFR